MITRSAVTSGKYVFAGNRAYVLRRMLSLGLNVVKIWAVRDSYLERYLNKERLSHTTIESKEQLCDEIDRTSFDYFISNGLPIILPISELRKKSKQFINIHPSLLPDLRGCDPIPGALLFHRDSGATCHVMDDGIDTGGIISQIKIPMTDDLDAGLLYQLSFMAEADAFEQAFERGFVACKTQGKGSNDLYYSYKEEDSLIDPQRENADAIFDKVRAFRTRNKSARIQIGKYTYTVINAFLIINPYANRLFESSPDCHVLMVYENSIVLKIKGKLMTWQIECEKLYEESKPQFPIIGSVIKKIGGGCILSDSEKHPSHIFVVHQFGFCQELFSEYQEEFADRIKRYIMNSSIKLRLYRPGSRMMSWLSDLDRAVPSRRVHYWCKRNFESQDESKMALPVDTFEMHIFDGQYDFGLDLVRRYYKNEEDFINYGKPVCARYGKDRPAGIIYSAGFDGLRNEADIFVSQPYRSRGLAKILSNQFCKVVSDNNQEITWDCYSNNMASRCIADYIGFEKSEEYMFYNIEPLTGL